MINPGMGAYKFRITMINLCIVQGLGELAIAIVNMKLVLATAVNIQRL